MRREPRIAASIQTPQVRARFGREKKSFCLAELHDVGKQIVFVRFVTERFQFSENGLYSFRL